MDAVKKRPTAENRTKWTMTLLTPAERERVEQAAGKELISLSSFIRRAVLRDLSRGGPITEELQKRKREAIPAPRVTRTL